MSSWRNDIQSLVKKCRILSLHVYPQVTNRCRVSDQGGTEFTLTASLKIHAILKRKEPSVNTCYNTLNVIFSAHRIHLSEFTYKLLEEIGGFTCEKRGTIPIKVTIVCTNS
jgi:hypothetical protein